MATKLTDPNPIWLDDTKAALAGGSLSFFDSGTTTPRNVYGEKAATTNLGSVITLNSAGRPSVNVWISGGPYRVTLKNSAGTQIWSKDEIYDLASAVAYTVPNPASGTNGQVIQTNGTAYSLATIVQVPDPTGHAGQQLGTDGVLVVWEAKAIATVYTATSLPGGIEQGATYSLVGKMLRLYGSDTAPTSANVKTTKAVTFTMPTGKTFTSILHVNVTASNAQSAGGVTVNAISRSNTGFTAEFTIATDHASDYRFDATQAFTYEVVGIIA